MRVTNKFPVILFPQSFAMVRSIKFRIQISALSCNFKFPYCILRIKSLEIMQREHVNFYGFLEDVIIPNELLVRKISNSFWRV